MVYPPGTATTVQLKRTVSAAAPRHLIACQVPGAVSARLPRISINRKQTALTAALKNRAVVGA